MRLEAEDLSALERDALRVIAECVTVPLDQLVRFLKRDLPAVRGLVVGLEAKGCLYSRQFFPGDEPWVWLSRAGSRLSGTGFGRRNETPSPLSLRHRRAIHEVRLYLEERAPQGRWVPERQLFRMRERDAELPDGLFEVDGERHAIEVELTRKSNGKIRGIVAENVSRYDAVIYFCSSETRSQLDRLKAEEAWPNLVVRGLPGEEHGRRGNVRPSHAYHQPEDWEIEVLRFIFEQRAVPIDQLSRVRTQVPMTTEAMVERFCEAGFARSEHVQIGEPRWVWLLGRGTRLAGMGPQGRFSLGMGNLVMLRALTELRFQIEARSREARWISRRMLLRGQGRGARAPGAVIEIDGERHALNVRFTRPQRGTRLPSMIDLQSRSYDAVIYLCGNARVRAYMEGLQERYGWRKLIIRDLASGLGEGGDRPARSYLLDSLP